VNDNIHIFHGLLKEFDISRMARDNLVKQVTVGAL
jgi:hypothetical protein